MTTVPSDAGDPALPIPPECMGATAHPLLQGPEPDVRRVMAALRGVMDPGVGENIVDLGLVERLSLSPGRAELVLAATTDSCPLSDLSADAALRAMQRVLPDTDLFVRHDPLAEWTPLRLSAQAQRRWRST